MTDNLKQTKHKPLKHILKANQCKKKESNEGRWEWEVSLATIDSENQLTFKIN